YARRGREEMRALAKVVGVGPNDDKPHLVGGLLQTMTTADRSGDGPCGHPIEPGVAGRTAFTLRVQTGCEERCAYCIIPSTRGAGRSMPIPDVVREAERVAQAGFKDVAITGVHLGSYGRDLSPSSSLLDLLRALNELPAD